MTTCPVCANSSTRIEPQEFVNCPRCGIYTVDRMPGGPDLLDKRLGNWDERSRRRRSRLSHLIRRQQRPSGEPVVSIPLDELEAWRLDDPLPSPAEQLDKLVLFVGDRQPSPAQLVKIDEEEVAAWIGCAVPITGSRGAGVEWLLQQPELEHLIAQPMFDPAKPRGGSLLGLSLTMAGWNRYESLKRAKVESRRAFMAMQFNDAELNEIVDNCFRPAVKRAGFELRDLTERQPAGSIDDQLRVALRTSRFVIADLTHGNHGAYWEAGFAEGLGRPVIYTCRKSVWDDPNERPHFDTSHLLTIIWDPEKLKEAEDRLTATIRATLPGEARMDDS